MQDDYSGAPGLLRMHVEGWRGYGHSIARVNQWQLVALAKRNDLAVTFSDAPMHLGLTQERGLLRPDFEGVIWGISGDVGEASADVEYRITSRVDVRPARRPARRLMVFAVAEYLGRPLDLIGADSPGELSKRDDITLIVPSNWVREILVRQKADASRVLVVPHGVDTELFKPDRRARRKIRAELNLNRFVFLNVGAMSGNKGIEDIFRAFLVVLERGIPATLILKGNDKVYNSKGWLDEALKVLSERDRARAVENMLYIGRFMTDEELATLYNAADAYISPYSAEGFNMPVLEAVASGLPVVCTAGGPTDDFTEPSFSRHIQSGLTLNQQGIGWLRPSLDHLTDLMTALYFDEEFRTQAREAGPAFVNANFTWDRVVDQLVAAARSG